MTSKKPFFKAFVIVLFLFTISLVIAKLPSIIKEYNFSEEISNKNKNNMIPIEANEENNFKFRAIDSTDHVDGDLSAPVQIVIYENFDCKFCADLADTMKIVKENFGNNIVIAYRHGVLTKKPLSYRAALAAECAGEQGYFWEMYNKLFYDFRIGSLNLDQFEKNAKDLGLLIDEFKQCIESEKYKEKIKNQIAEAYEISAYGSPTIFINQEIFPGAYPFKDFIDENGKKQEGIESIINRYLSNINEN